MKIEIDELVSTKGNGAFWGCGERKGMTGGDVKIQFGLDKEYKFNLQKFVFYVVHRSEGKGFTKNIKKYEEGN
jgi:hypothetical protein